MESVREGSWKESVLLEDKFIVFVVVARKLRWCSQSPGAELRQQVERQNLQIYQINFYLKPRNNEHILVRLRCTLKNQM